jgi:predicted membrane channel-forming protein YqfA (hemolysin III family)
MTAVPTALWFIALVASYVIRRRIPRFNRNFYIAFGILIIAMVFFVRGLDEDNDYLRLNHGLWHMSASLSAYFFFGCVQSVSTQHADAKSGAHVAASSSSSSGGGVGSSATVAAGAMEAGTVGRRRTVSGK